MNKTDNKAATEELQENIDESVENPIADEPINQGQEADELEKAGIALQEMKDKYLRLAAEFDNYRRRTAQERLEERQTAGRDLIVSLLDVLDDCDRAEKVMAGDQDAETMKEGVRLVFQKLKSTLESKGLKAMETTNQEFDTDLHEAIAEIPAPSQDMQGKIMDEVQKGYKLNDRIIRFAKVVVGK